MKNFKLLLATTAILSIGALSSNAEVTMTMHPTVTMLMDAGASIVTHLGFGAINWEKGKKITIAYNNGDIDISGDATYIGGAQLGKVAIDGPGNVVSYYELAFPKEDVVLYGNYEGTEYECGKITDFSQIMASDGGFERIFVGGTFEASEKISWSGVPFSCTGDAEITLVLKE